MFTNNLDPIAFQVLSFEIRWYSLAYIVGILIGWLLSKRIFIKNLGISQKFDDYISYLIIGIIVGGRLGYIIFYNFNHYINNIFDILKIWEGGMSFHGAVMGIIVASIIFAKKHNQNPFMYMDLLVLMHQMDKLSIILIQQNHKSLMVSKVLPSF